MKYALFAAVGAVCVATGAAPLLTEDFEATARSLREKGWHLADAAGLAPESRDGSTCLKMACPHRKAYAEYFVPVEKGKMYRARAWVKCENVKRDPASPQNRGAVLFCQFANADKGWVGGGTFPKGLHGTRAWTCLEVNYTATIPESVAYIQVMLGIEGVGTAWFDDVMVEEITEWDSPAVISPRDGKAVESLRPVLAWEAALPHESYRVELAADSEFRRAGTQSQLVWGGDTRPANPLGPGEWFWRIRTVTSRGSLPWTATRRFVVPPDAAPWPPRFTPRWTALDTDRPELRADITPSEWITRLEATVGGIPCAVRRTDDGIMIVPRQSLPRGIHDVAVTAHGTGGRRTTFTECFTNKKPGCRVSVRDDGILIVNGNPFFPLGAYRDPSDTLTDFTGLKSAGFNVTHSYAFEEKTRSVDKARAYLKAADAEGLRVFLGFSRSAIRTADLPQWGHWTAELMDEPGLLTWYMMDEPICHRIPPAAFEQLYSVIHRYDAYHPASLLLARISPVTDIQRAYASCCDVLWCDPYPIPDRSLTMVESRAVACRDAAGPGRPFWVVLQAHDLRYWKGREREYRKHGGPVTRPTGPETRCMTHLALSTGAHGLIWYWGPNYHYHIERDAAPVWEGMCAVLKELHELMPWLVAPRRAEDSIPLPDPFRCWSRTHAGTRVLAVVNASETAARLHTPLDLLHADGKQIMSRDPDTPVEVRDGTLQDTFPPWAVRVYQWQE